MPPTQSTVAAVPTPLSSATPTHRASIPAMVVLALFLSMMAALAIGVTLRHRREVAASKSEHTSSQEKSSAARASRSWFARFKSRSNADNGDDYPTTVGALHATSVLLAAAPCHMFSPPMTMHFRIPLQDKTILILGAQWLGGARCCGAPAYDCPETCHRRRHL